MKGSSEWLTALAALGRPRVVALLLVGLLALGFPEAAPLLVKHCVSLLNSPDPMPQTDLLSPVAP